MKKTIVLTMLVLLMFVAGCGPVPWRDFYQSHAENIIGLESVYYRKGRLTFKFDEKYAKTDDDGYCDFIGLIRNGDYPRFYRDPVAYEPDPVLDPDTSDLIDPELIIPEVIMHIRHRESGVYWGSRDPFCGVCLLKYDVSSDYLYYEFMFDGRASLYVDAHTGEISDTLMV